MEKVYYLAYRSLSQLIIERSQGRKSRQKLKQSRPWRGAAYCLACSVCFLTQSRTTRPGVVPLTSTANQGNDPQTGLQVKSEGCSSLVEVPSSRMTVALTELTKLVSPNHPKRTTHTGEDELASRQLPCLLPPVLPDMARCSGPLLSAWSSFWSILLAIQDSFLVLHIFLPLCNYMPVYFPDLDGGFFAFPSS